MSPLPWRSQRWHVAETATTARKRPWSRQNAATLSAVAALTGSAIGALATFATTWLTQHHNYEFELRGDAAREELDLLRDFTEIFRDDLGH